jgi:hypothetical protein
MAAVPNLFEFIIAEALERMTRRLKASRQQSPHQIRS